jgi:hypothetical protein
LLFNLGLLLGDLLAGGHFRLLGLRFHDPLRIGWLGLQEGLGVLNTDHRPSATVDRGAVVQIRVLLRLGAMIWARKCRSEPAVMQSAPTRREGGTMIVSSRPPHRKHPKPAQPVEITAPRIVQHLPKHRREPKPRVRDPEGEARVEAFFLRMGLTLPKDWAN